MVVGRIMHSNYHRIKQNQERIVPLPPIISTSPVLHIRHFETILYELIYLLVSLKVVYIRDPGKTQSVIRTFNRQLTHRRHYSNITCLRISSVYIRERQGSVGYSALIVQGQHVVVISRLYSDGLYYL